MSSKPSKQMNGALLIEVLFAITLLVFGITACLRAMGQGLEITKRSREYTQAEIALDELMFRLLSGAEETLLTDGGDGKFDSQTLDLPDLQYHVESRQINPYVPPTEEELKAMAREGVEPAGPDKKAETEENYRMINAKVMWRGGKEELELFTIMRLSDAGVAKK